MIHFKWSSDVSQDDVPLVALLKARCRSGENLDNESVNLENESVKISPGLQHFECEELVKLFPSAC